MCHYDILKGMKLRHFLNSWTKAIPVESDLNGRNKWLIHRIREEQEDWVHMNKTINWKLTDIVFYNKDKSNSLKK